MNVGPALEFFRPLNRSTVKNNLRGRSRFVATSRDDRVRDAKTQKRAAYDVACPMLVGVKPGKVNGSRGHIGRYGDSPIRIAFGKDCGGRKRDRRVAGNEPPLFFKGFKDARFVVCR